MPEPFCPVRECLAIRLSAAEPGETIPLDDQEQALLADPEASRLIHARAEHIRRLVAGKRKTR